jgi:hypothetical protein
MQCILQMCLASLVYHTDKVLHFGPNDIARNSIPIFRDPSKMQAAIRKIKIVYAWEDSCGTITGVPPHIKQLVDLKQFVTARLTLLNRWKRLSWWESPSILTLEAGTYQRRG